MRVFLSYSHADRDAAELIAAALRNEGHDVFFDQSALHGGDEFHAEIRKQVQSSQLFVFLISPRSVASGSYALTELGLIEQRPGARLLPVEVAATEMATIPASLRTVEILRARGDLTAEVEAEVARIAEQVARRRWTVGAIAAAGVVAVLAAGTGVALRGRPSPPASTLSEPARQALSTADVHLKTGDYAAAWRLLGETLAREPPSVPVQEKQEQVAMVWLRDIHVFGGGTFAEIVDKVRPALSRGIGAGRPYAADLWAHLGWSEYLLSKEGTATRDPADSYREALAREPGNTYAHAMLGHWMMVKSRPAAEALREFDAAVRSGRELVYVRQLELAALLYYHDEKLEPQVVAVANAMRKTSVPLSEHDARQIGYIVRQRLLHDNLVDLTAVVTPADLLATFDWAVEEPDDQSGKMLHTFCRSRLLELAGRPGEALPGYQRVAAYFKGDKAGGPLPEQNARGLLRLTGH